MAITDYFAAMGSANWIIMGFIVAYVFFFTAFLFFLYYYFLRFPVEVNIYAEQGSGTIRSKKFGRIIDIHGIREIHFMFGGKMSCPDNKFFFLSRNLFRKLAINVRRDGMSNHTPIGYDNPSQGTMDAVEQDIRFWYFNANKDAADLWDERSTLMKYAPQIMMLAFIVMIFVLTIVLLNKIGDIIPPLQQIAATLSSAVTAPQ